MIYALFCNLDGYSYFRGYKLKKVFSSLELAEEFIEQEFKERTKDNLNLANDKPKVIKTNAIDDGWPYILTVEFFYCNEQHGLCLELFAIQPIELTTGEPTYAYEFIT